MHSNRVRVGVDIGGTFTDFVFLDENTGEIHLEKTSTTPKDLWEGIATGLEKAKLDLSRVSMFIHGTTVGLNAFLERKGKKTGLITTRGFRDVYEIGRHNRIEMYDLFYKKPEPLVPREYRREVTERIDADGNIVIPLAEEEVRECARFFRKAGIESIAICFLHSYANPVHELRAGEIVASEYPEASISLSHAIANEWREYERTSTTCINAYIMPVVGSYLSRMEKELGSRGYNKPFYIHKSSGGLMSADVAKIKPVHTIMSGPAAGVVSAASVGKLAGFENVISFDMGGTSTDVAITYRGNTRVTVDAQIDRHPVMVPMVDIHSIGAGGGSIAWINEAGALNVGPQSAGSDPGPACYGKGGTEPTVTDANLVLGRLDPNNFLGGEIAINPELARKAINEKIARPLNLTLEEAASGIISVVNTKMAYAIRATTIQRGLDPKEFVLLAFGGAGPMHACALAKELGIPKVLIPMAPGAFSALGMLLTDIRQDYVRTVVTLLDSSRADQLEAIFQEMAQEAVRTLREQLDNCEVRMVRSADMRYVGQEYTVSVPVPAEGISQEALPRLRESFNRLHEQIYGHHSDTEPVEIINLRLTAFGEVPKVKFAQIPKGTATPPREAFKGTLKAKFDGVVDCPVYQREALLAGNTIEGPAVIQEKGATTVLLPGCTLVVSDYGYFMIEVKSDG